VRNSSSYKAIYLTTICLDKDVYTINNLVHITYSLAKGTINAILIIVGRVIRNKANLYNKLEAVDNIPIDNVITALYASNNYLK